MPRNGLCFSSYLTFLFLFYLYFGGEGLIFGTNNGFSNSFPLEKFIIFCHGNHGNNSNVTAVDKLRNFRVHTGLTLNLGYNFSFVLCCCDNVDCFEFCFILRSS